MTVVQTYTGARVDLLDPKPEAINITDIAHHLAQICRFTGATREHYSVAQHSVLVAAMVPPECAFRALLHDAHEAYMGDISQPVKEMIRRNGNAAAVLTDISNGLNGAIAQRFDLVDDSILPSKALPFGHHGIKHADLRALATERRDLMVPDPTPWPSLEGVEPHPEPIRPLSAEAAERLFLDTFAQLTG
jgi:hypothetical protein